MSVVKIQIFHENNAKSETKMVRTIRIERDSEKKLTAKQAKQILAAEFPQFKKLGVVSLIKFENSFRASRTIKPAEKCDYHYIWERAIITEEETD